MKTRSDYIGEVKLLIKRLRGMSHAQFLASELDVPVGYTRIPAPPIGWHGHDPRKDKRMRRKRLIATLEWLRTA